MNIPEETFVDSDGSRVTIFYKLNENGQKVKVTRRVISKIIPASFKKFGDSKGLPDGPDSNSTNVGEAVNLKLARGFTDEDVEEENKRKQALQKANITCRICKGQHWTSKCPYKDSQAPDASPDAKAGGDSAGGSKYVPPSLRGKKPGEGTPYPGQKDRRDENTIRITNLSSETYESDVRELVTRFGQVSRIYVAKDPETNTCKGFAFVSYVSREAAERAISVLNGHGYDNLILKAEWSNRN